MKRLLLVLVVLAASLVLIGFVLPGSYDVQRAVAVIARPDAVYRTLAELRTWPEWTVWSKRADPSAEWTFTGGPGQGAVWTWRGDRFGSGRLLIETAEPEQGITYSVEVSGMEPMFGSIDLAAAGDATTVTWRDRGEFGWNPLLRWLGVLSWDSMVGSQLEANLAALKQRTEAAGPVEAAFEKK